MLPKRTFSLVMQQLKKIKKNWDEDRLENPNIAPYEITSQLKNAIEHAMRETSVSGSRTAKERAVDECIAYLINKGHIIGSPYGGVMFPLPEGQKLPSKEEMVKDIQRRFNELEGKRNV